MKKIFLLLLISVQLYTYEFTGEHYMANFYDCENLYDNNYVFSSFIEAVWKCGARFCEIGRHDFHPIGMTAFCVLYESHASIHTYPEKGNVYVDLFTCGDHSFWELFEKILIEKLKPQDIKSKVSHR